VCAERRHVLCSVTDVAPGDRRVIAVAGRSIGVFNVDGTFYALHNGCPHKGGPLCEGRVGGTTLAAGGRAFTYGRDGQILRCAWHGWEFDITTGRALADPTVGAHTYPVTVEDGQVVLRL
jgi:nitrite reductase (NADH) small subunit